MAKMEPVRVPVIVERVPSAGEYWRIAGRVSDLIADLHGGTLEHWAESLQYLVRDAQRAAGAECVHEVERAGEAGEQRPAA